MNNEFENQDNPEWEERLNAMANVLPREREPGRLLEERTVAALRKKGMLKPRRRRGLHPAWMAGGIAAAFALFVTGVVVGQWMGTRTTAVAIMTGQKNEAMNSALQVQRTGSAYVDALQAMA